MLYFVWSDPFPLFSGRGGTESLTIGHIRELRRRGVDSQILTYGLGEKDGREFYPDVEFRSISSLKEIEKLDGTVIFLNIPHAIPTKRQSFVMFHFQPFEQHGKRSRFIRGVGNSIVITNSRFMRSYFADYLDKEETSIQIIYPFADPVFSQVERPKKTTKKTRVLFAGRLSPEKGIYTLLEALHHPIADWKPLADKGFIFSVTNAGNQTTHGQVLEQILNHHPWIQVIPAQHTPAEVASLFAQFDIVVMPSNDQYWHEPFGMISVEAQHAGCRVIASKSGGLPETNCGELILIEPDNSFALYRALQKAAKLGPLSNAGRKEAVKHFKLTESMDMLLNVINNP